MIDNAVAIGASDEHRLERFRRVERVFWAHYGLEPTDRTVEIPSQAGRVHVQESGSGDPVLFIHGTGGSGSYFAPLVKELQGFRCLVVDRPGWGLSSMADYSATPYRAFTAGWLRDTLQALGVSRVDVVGASIGNLWALRLAQAFPDMVGRVVLLGGGPLNPGIEVPPFIRLLRSPIGAIIVRIPERAGMFRKQLAGMGHGASLQSARIPEAFIEWHVAMSATTDWARNEREMVRQIVKSRGFAPDVIPDETELARLTKPTLMVYGTADPVGSVDVWTRFIGKIPHGELELVDAGGHLVWLDDPVAVGRRIQGFLRQSSSG
jgi:pimeloyl-ACP methyl ester carboxylesterase